MQNIDITTIVVKFFSKEASKNEIEILENWLSIEQNRIQFDKLEKIWFAPYQYHGTKKNKLEAKHDFLNFVREESRLKSRIRILSFIKYAAVFAIAVLGVFIINSYHSNTYNFQLSKCSDLEISKFTSPSLRTEKGECIKLHSNETKQINASDGTVVNKNIGSELIYNKDTFNSKKSVIHELVVPRAKRMDIVLSDGTKVWLNSESVLRFPTYFDGETRVVFLEGEAFFDVAKNPNKAFIVKTSDLNIRVLGTKFNLSSYNNENTIDVSLEEGSIGMYKSTDKYKPNKLVKIRPNQIASFNKLKKNHIKISNCDVGIYSSWRYGKLQFRHEKFSKLKIKLERWYNVKITNHNIAITNVLFSGDFDKEDIREVMEILKRNIGLEYEIKGNEIKILPLNL
ncbi:MAG: FecR family protein [Marinifilaceae bacterium]|jgi:ferric-dicitrate binding protein FerR (iron transport regulator)|nr:FecR family protein [Marinifilaceae bacterium]